MAFIFTMRSQPGQSRSRSSTLASNFDVPEDHHLSVIMENADDPPPIPPKAAHRPAFRRFQLGNPPQHEHDVPPPPYSAYAGIIGPNGEKLNDVRNNKYIARRGGWKRVCLVFFVIVAVLVGLIVGLVVGLKHKHSSPPPAANSTSPGPPPNGPFPLGSWTYETFLDTITTNCTSQASTWRCYPYSTLSSDPSTTGASFQWLIHSVPNSNPPAYTISSTSNPFAFMFSSIPLALLDAGSPSERYTFSTHIDIVTIPTQSIGSDPHTAQCYFNGTTFTAELYTKMPKDWTVANGTSAASSSAPTSTSTAPTSTSTKGPYAPWPYAVNVQYSIGGGNDVPTCYQLLNGAGQGSRVTDGLMPEPSGDMCGCLYKNYLTEVQ